MRKISVIQTFPLVNHQLISERRRRFCSALLLIEVGDFKQLRHISVSDHAIFEQYQHSLSINVVGHQELEGRRLK